MSIGTNGMMIAAKTLAATAVELFSNPSHVMEGLAELEREREEAFVTKRWSETEIPRWTTGRTRRVWVQSSSEEETE